MVIIVHSTETEKSIAANIGAKDYSYFFVLKKFKTVLKKFARVYEVENPSLDVDRIYSECQVRKEQCLFLSFTPPFKTVIGLRCPTISVFAWEYATIPTDPWGEEPRNDWRTVFNVQLGAITHSNFAVRAVQQAMGESYPVFSIPAPLWDEFSKNHRKGKAFAQSKDFYLHFAGVLLDFRGCRVLPFSEENAIPEERSSSINGNEVGVHLKGIIYTAVFNPNDGRKNWMDFLWAFCWAFREQEDVTLVMKLAYHDYEGIRMIIINEIKKVMPFKCRVVAMHGYLNEDAYRELIRGSTYVVNTSHGEGQCLPLMEFMSAGKPALAPQHTAMEDYVNPDNAFIIKSSIEWTHWPHDPRQALRTFRYRIQWESIYEAYRSSYHVAKNEPGRYAYMSDCANESLEKYCSKSIVQSKLKRVFQELGVTENIIVAARMKLLYFRVQLSAWIRTCPIKTILLAQKIKSRMHVGAIRVIHFARSLRMRISNKLHLD